MSLSDTSGVSSSYCGDGICNGNEECGTTDASPQCNSDCGSCASVCGAADTNSNDVVEIGEIINYITRYKNSEIDIGEIISAITEYKNGC